MTDLLLSFRSAVAEGDYREAGWKSTGTRPATPYIVSPSADINQARRKRFIELAEQWLSDTKFMSSVTDIISHPAYRSIIAMGTPVVSLILERLERRPDFWFEALREITGDNPVHEEDIGDLDLMATAWLEWGAKHDFR